jgi:tetratricopeptide (TPR) repeat protein
VKEARLSLLLKYLEEEPNDPFNLYAIASEYLSESIDKAKEYFDQLLEKHPDYLPTYFHAAQLYVDIEEEGEAVEIYKKGIALAALQENSKTKRELESAYQNLLFELD